ncbi:PREDICTED: probable methyltransferase PMT27 isoform X2 [Lupinus angustifolius]|uniref:probable methyltransferase PMT27 isoform X2 n=1 Tax=Lupinus angustifolius TaxID=3871 RepID=UPI00092EB8A8|nr:PREDICTED: probable methyltransferase PMT27 isoform X2 [Lupinus angustifolius]
MNDTIPFSYLEHFYYFILSFSLQHLPPQTSLICLCIPTFIISFNILYPFQFPSQHNTHYTLLMALFKSRNNRRSSSPSYVSTLTTLLFIALCVFGVWIYRSNTGVSPQTQTDEATSTRMSVDTSSTTNNDLSSTEDTLETTTKVTDESAETITNRAIEELAETNSKIESQEDTSTTEDSAETNTKSESQKDTSTTTTTVFGDNPGHLPDDAIKSDDKNNNNEANKQKGASSDSEISEASSVTQEEQVTSMSESGSEQNSETEKVQQGSAEAYEGNKKDEEGDAKAQDATESQNANEAETQELSTGQKQDVLSFDTNGSKNDEEEANKEQLREDKGEITKKDENFESKKGETSQVSETESEKNENQGSQDESEQRQKPKAEKKDKKSKKAWATQADQSHNEKKRQKGELDNSNSDEDKEKQEDNTWYLCNVTAGADYIPCLDNEKAIKKLRSTKHFQHRERHCPEDPPTCLVSLPSGYKTSIEWPGSRDKIWYHNVPQTLLAEVKGHQNWVKVTGEYLTFPGGGTQFIHGALHYIDFVQQAETGIAWGKRTRVILDVGCGVGSFGGYLFERDVIAMSFAPKDEHVAQVQFALERGIPAISAVMGSQRLPFPSRVFDLVHCARCRVPWSDEGGILLLELNRVLRPGGYFVWSATPVYQKLEEDVQIWNEMSLLTKSMCWELVTINKDKLNQVGAAIYRKPTSNECYEQREKSEPPMCKDDDDPNAAWYVPLQACMHKVPDNKAERGAKWPEEWPSRLQKTPYWLNNSQIGIYGKPAAKDFAEDNERWKNVVDELSNIGITWSNVRNVMDMKAVYGGFAAALGDLPVWVFNVVNIDSPDTLPIIYERGLFGIYHDWCESFSTYPRTYDLLHADNLFSKLKERCKLAVIMAEVDRIARPGGKLIVRDESSTISEVEALLKSLHWEIIFSNDQKDLLSAKKGTWRPDSVASS